jgi:chemotaxis signal transduction protein
MKLGRIEKRKTRSRRGEAVILFTVAGQKFAIAADAVEEIRSTEGMKPLAHSFARGTKVRHMLLRDHRQYPVIDTNVHLRMLSSHPTRLLLLRQHLAMTADSIERMAEIATLHPLPKAFAGEERQWYRGLALLGEDVVPVLNSAALLSPAELEALAPAMTVAAEHATAKGAASA